MLISVYDVRGNVVRQLYLGHQAAGLYQIGAVSNRAYNGCLHI